MKTVPTVHLAEAGDTASFPQLPEETTLALADIAGAAREGLLAMSVAAGMAVMQAMLEAEVTQVAGPKGKHDPDRTVNRHGTGRGSVTLGGRRVSVTRPRARTTDGHEVPLASYGHFAAEDLLVQVVLERMLAGVASRRHARVGEPVGEQAAKTAKSTSKSAVSRRFVKQTQTALAELMARDLTELDVKVLMLDGEHMAERCVVVALAITGEGTKIPVGGVGRLHGEQDRGQVAAGATWSPAAWPSRTGCWSSSTAPRRSRPRCGRCSATRRWSNAVPCTSAGTWPTTCPRRTRHGWTPSRSRRSGTPTPSRGCVTPGSWPGC
jgi:hypothetical protein